MESISLKNLKKGECFFTTKEDKTITALAVYYNIKVKTERYTAIDKSTNTKIEKLVKVTIL